MIKTCFGFKQERFEHFNASAWSTLKIDGSSKMESNGENTVNQLHPRNPISKPDVLNVIGGLHVARIQTRIKTSPKVVFGGQRLPIADVSLGQP
jgi:hypothetical protein